jgi:hypothetical protein
MFAAGLGIAFVSESMLHVKRDGLVVLSCRSFARARAARGADATDAVRAREQRYSRWLLCGPQLVRTGATRLIPERIRAFLAR